MPIDAARLYLVIAARPDIAEAALRGGVDVVQLRDKSASDDELLDAGRELRQLCTAYDALFIVNDFPELAMCVNADGVHVGQDDVSAAEARRVVGRAGWWASPPTRRRTSPPRLARTTSASARSTPLRPNPAAPRWASGSLPRRRALRACRGSPSAASRRTPSRRCSAAGTSRVAVARAIRDARDPQAAVRGLSEQLRRSPAAIT